MSGGKIGRRALLGATALLPGCSVLDDILGETKRPLPGERRSVIRAEPTVAADAGDQVAVTLPAAEPIGSWPMAGGPPGHAPGNVALGERLAVAWRASAGSGSGYRQRLTSGPVIADGVIYTVDAWGDVSATTLADGRRRWSVDTVPEDEGALPLGGGVAVADGTVYVATGGAELLALAPTDGSVKWRERLPAGARGAPTVAGGRVFVPTVENQLIAMAADDGRRLWTHRGAALFTIPMGLPAPAVDGDTVVAGYGTGEVFALRASDGRVLWAETLGGTANFSLADFVGVTGLPAIDRGRVFVTGLANISIAVDLRSGRRLWERPFGGGNGLAPAGDWVFAVTRSNEAIAVGREDGRVRWVTELDPAPPAGRRGDPPRFGPPLVGGGRILVSSSRGELLILDPSDGRIAGRVPLGSGVTLPMAVTDGTLVALADDGTIIALR